MTFRLENKTAFKLVIQVALLEGSARMPTLLTMEGGCQLCRGAGPLAKEALEPAPPTLRGLLLAGAAVALTVCSYKGLQRFPKHWLCLTEVWGA